MLIRMPGAVCWITLVVAWTVLIPASSPAADAKPIDFAHDVVPVLRKHCVDCHGGKESKGGFSINSRPLILDAEAVVPGKSTESELIRLVTSEDVEEQMPPKGRPRLTAREIDVLRRWIDEGLKWEGGFSFDRNRYEPPLRPRRPVLPPTGPARANPIDRILAACFAEHGVQRPRRVSDATFLRRVSLDVTGLLPEPDRLEQFLASSERDKRQRLIRELLDDDFAYAEHWLTFWNDLLRNDYTGTGFITRGRTQITKWLHRSLVENKPYDQFTRELIAPQPEAAGYINGIKWRGDVSASQAVEIQFAQSITQSFLGINMKCASCHDSFIDRWTLEETWNLAAIYSNRPLELHRCDKPIGRMATPAWMFPELGQIDPKAPQPERLKQLAALMTHPENGRFTRTIVNRIWHRLMGRGIVHPVDAMHTRPWSEDLLDYLAVHLADNIYDLKKTIELICSSEAYQSATPPMEDSGEAIEYVFRGPLPRRMTAEQFMDAVWQLTGAAPLQHEVDVMRFPTNAIDSDEFTSQGRWIWSPTAAGSNVPKAGEKIAVRKVFKLPAAPQRAVVAITCDNEYTLIINGRKVADDKSWETVEVLSVGSELKAGENSVIVIARNAGNAPNPAGLFFECRIRVSDVENRTVASGADWEWQGIKANRFKNDPKGWKPASVLKQVVWDKQTAPQIRAALAHAANSPVLMVRASLVKNNYLMRALGRPNCDQIVTMRPSSLTTLEAIDLANGQTLADAIAVGSRRALDQHNSSAAKLATWLYSFALSRKPTSEERQLVLDLLGDKPTEEDVQDLMWAVLMLPEFQLVR